MVPQGQKWKSGHGGGKKSKDVEGKEGYQMMALKQSEKGIKSTLMGQVG